MLTATFDELTFYDEGSKFRWKCTNIGTLKLGKPVEYVESNLLQLHKMLKEKLVQGGLMPKEPIGQYLFSKINNITERENAAKVSALRIIEAYLETKKEPSRLN